MVDAAGDFGRVWHGIQSDASAVFAFWRVVRGDASQPGGDGLHRAKDDDEPISLAAKNVVVAADGRDGNVAVRGSAQRRRGAVALAR